MAKLPSPKADQLRALRERQVAEDEQRARAAQQQKRKQAKEQEGKQA